MIIEAMNVQNHSGEVILIVQVKAIKNILPKDQHIERQYICPSNILTTWNFANTIHSNNDKMQPDHVELIDRLVRQNNLTIH